MTTRFASRNASLFLSLSLGACASVEPDTSGTDESAVGNCGFIPGCLELREASAGPFIASVMTREEPGGAIRRSLAVTYREPVGSSFLLCSRFPNQPALTAVFVLGAGGARTSVARPMRVDCPTSWGDNGGQTNSATLSVDEQLDPALWDTLFPPAADGARWFALELAATNAAGAWDSRYGANYQLVLEPR